MESHGASPEALLDHVPEKSLFGVVLHAVVGAANVLHTRMLTSWSGDSCYTAILDCI